MLNDHGLGFDYTFLILPSSFAYLLLMFDFLSLYLLGWCGFIKEYEREPYISQAFSQTLGVHN